MMTLKHLPTWLLIIGYPAYWIELYFFKHPTGQTTWLATAAFLFVALAVLFRVMQCLCAVGARHAVPLQDDLWGKRDPAERFFFVTAGLFVLGILIVVGLAGSLPPHLVQEYDALNYHITIPRQHLFFNSFAHLSWSTADLFLLPVDFALAPYWLATSLPNKWPQLIFFVGLLIVAMSLAKRLGGADRWKSAVLFFLLIGAHGLAIQAGTAMLDIALCYLFVAAIDSFLSRRFCWAAIEFAFFAFSKPAVPLLCVVLFFVVAGLFMICRRMCPVGFVGFGEKSAWAGMKPRDAKRFWMTFALVGLIVGGPFMAKGLYYAGTPVYPIGAGLVKDYSGQSAALRQQIEERAREHMVVRDGYGATRGLKDFMAHFWVLSVPEKGVNNRFDYPLGLPILLILGPFLFFLGRSLYKRNFPFLPVVIVVYWLLWWLGSQQSRFLFIPLVLMAVVVVAELPRMSRVFLGCILISLGLTALSVYRAHAADFGKSPVEVLREYDRALVERGRTARPGEIIEVDPQDAAMAPFIIDVKKENGFYVLTP